MWIRHCRHALFEDQDPEEESDSEEEPDLGPVDNAEPVPDGDQGNGDTKVLHVYAGIPQQPQITSDLDATLPYSHGKPESISLENILEGGVLPSLFKESSCSLNQPLPPQTSTRG